MNKLESWTIPATISQFGLNSALAEKVKFIDSFFLAPAVGYPIGSRYIFSAWD